MSGQGCSAGQRRDVPGPLLQANVSSRLFAPQSAAPRPGSGFDDHVQRLAVGGTSEVLAGLKNLRPLEAMRLDCKLVRNIGTLTVSTRPAAIVTWVDA